MKKTHKVVLTSLAITAAALAAPFAAYADTTSSTISSNIGSTINVLTSNGTVNVNATPTGSGVQTIAKDTITVSTNNSAGYTLKLSESTAATSMVSGSNTIPTSTGSQATPIAQVANSWGYRVDGVGGFGAGPTSAVSNAAISAIKFAGVPVTASPNTLKTTATTATNNTTDIWYGVAVNTATPSGTYTNDVTYTVTTN